VRDAVESNVQSVAEIPYFEGDYWPNILEDCSKEMDQEEEDRRKREQVEAAATTGADGLEVTPELEDTGEVRTLVHNCYFVSLCIAACIGV